MRALTLVVVLLASGSASAQASPFARSFVPLAAQIDLPALAADSTALASAPRASVPAAGAAVEATFGPDAMQVRGAPIDAYVYAGTAGERLHVRIASDVVPALCIASAAAWAAARTGTAAAGASDASVCARATASRPAEIDTVLPTDGDVVVLVVGAPGAVGGRYQLKTVDAGEHVGLLAAGPAVQAMLGDGGADEVRMNGQAVGTHFVEGRAGDRFVVTVASEAFAPYAEVGTGAGTGYRSFVGAEADSSGTARLQIVLPTDGVYSVLLADGHGRGVGAYSVRVERDAARPWAEVYPGGGAPAGRYALLVGIADYPGVGPAGNQSDLRGPPTDVETMRALLVETYGFDPANVVVLRDAEATRERVTEAVQRHLGQAGPAGRAVFYYSGHGMQIPTEALTAEPDGQDESLVLWGRGDAIAPLLDFELGALVDSLSAGRTVVVLDDCFSGTGTRGAQDGFAVRVMAYDDVSARVQAPPAAVRPADRTAEPIRHVLLAASRSDQPSLELDGLGGLPGRRGVFTHFLAAALRAAGPDATFESVVAGLRPEIARATRTIMAQAVGGPPQQPQVEGAQRTDAVRDALGSHR